ncbi:MAG: YajQ family cyclic di-GMP-binding protein, partial [Elusimicrobia bacterium]|nr:YajQ family cyclic di-GMP-binding protein [Elusimicrobiota bacterium]MBD3412730.1 YajQ family cyclic di-GMP-binding protein [Elusimicrobiota bacterium]
DIVSRINLQEVDNAINQSTKEISTRYDFRGTHCAITRDNLDITLLADDEYRLKSVIDIFKTKLAKRGVPLKGMQYKNIESAAGGSVRQKATIQQGIPTEKAKEIVKIIKNAPVKVQPAIQGDQIRVTGKSRDDLQSVIALLKNTDPGIPLEFTNYR